MDWVLIKRATGRFSGREKKEKKHRDRHISRKEMVQFAKYKEKSEKEREKKKKKSIFCL